MRDVPRGEVPESELSGRPVRLSMDQTQRIVHARFASAGIRLQPAHQLCEPNLVLALSGFDPERRVGYVYIATGAPELSRATTRALSDMAVRDEAHIMIVYEDDMPDVDVLERHIDGFFTGLPPARREPTLC